MRPAAHLFGLATLTALLVPVLEGAAPAVQKPGFFEETRFLQAPGTVSTAGTLAGMEPLPLKALPSEHLAQNDVLLEEAERLLEQGNQLRQVSQFQEALQSFQQALELYRNPVVQSEFSKESRWGEGNALRGLGNIRFSLGNYEQALNFYEQALEVFRSTVGSQDERFRQGEGYALNNLGNAHYVLGNYERSLDYYEQALRSVRDINDRRGEGLILNNLGLVITYGDAPFNPFSSAFLGVFIPAVQTLQNGSSQQAVDFFGEALSIFRELGDRQAEGSTLGNLGNVYASEEPD